MLFIYVMDSCMAAAVSENPLAPPVAVPTARFPRFPNSCDRFLLLCTYDVHVCKCVDRKKRL